MKKMKLFLIVLLSLFALGSLNAQTSFTTKTVELTHFHAIFPSTLIDSTDTVYSEWFTLAGYDYETDYIGYTDTSTGLAGTLYRRFVHASYKLSSTLGKPRILAVIQGTNNTDDASSLYTIDTLSANADSLETYQYTHLDFNGKRFLKYRLAITGTAGNRSDTYFKGELYLPRKKF